MSHLSVIRPDKNIAEDVVSVLKWATELADNGEIAGITIVVVTKKQETINNSSATTERHRMLAALYDALVDFQRDADMAPE